MANQVFRCLQHGEYEMTVPTHEDVPERALCPGIVTCDKGYEHPCPYRGRWVPSVPNFIGGPTTGAKQE